VKVLPITGLLLREYQRNALLLALLVVVPVIFITVSIYNTEDIPLTFIVRDNGERISITESMVDVHGAIMVPITAAFLASLVGLFTMLGAARSANRYMPLAHAQGYSQDVCSYLTSDIGAYLAGETPLSAFGLTSVPRADVLVFNTNQCRDVRDWFEWYGRRWNVPVIGVRSPRSIELVTDNDVDAVAQQIEALIPPLEAVAGARLDASRLSAGMPLSFQAPGARRPFSRSVNSAWAEPVV